MYTIHVHVEPFLHTFQKILSDIPLNTFIHSNLGVMHFQILTNIIKLITILSRGDRLKILVKFGERDDFSQ